MKLQHPKLFGSAALKAVGLFALISLFGCHGQEKNIAEPAAPKVDGDTITFASDSSQTAALTIQTAQPRTLAATHLTGRLCWNDAMTVRVFTPVAGRVLAIRADLGDDISAGEPLAEIDSPDFNQALSSARTAAGNLAAADKAFARSQELLAHGAAAQKDVEAAEAAFVAAAAEKDRAEAVLANYGGSTTTTNSVYLLRSPLAGQLVEKNLSPGQEVRADLMLANAPNLFAPLFVVSDPTQLWLQLDVAESDLPLLQSGQHLQIHSRAYPGKIFEGVIEKIGNALDPNIHTIKVRGLVKNPHNLLKAEMYVSVDLAQDAAKITQAGVEIPTDAVFLKGEKHYVFVQQQPLEFKRQEVSVGDEVDGRVLIPTGLISGQRVVTDGCIFLQEILE